MPATKKKFNARFPPARIKKIMQTDEEVGKVAAAVPVLVSKAVEIFMESLLTKAGEQTTSRRARTMSVAHLRRCILQEKQFDFLKDLVANVMHADDDAADGGDGILSGPSPSRKSRGGRSTASSSSRHGSASSAAGRALSISDKEDGNNSGSEKSDGPSSAAEMSVRQAVPQPVEVSFPSLSAGSLFMQGLTSGSANDEDDDDDYDS